jgi:hypothetical protein
MKSCNNVVNCDDNMLHKLKTLRKNHSEQSHHRCISQLLLHSYNVQSRFSTRNSTMY